MELQQASTRVSETNQTFAPNLAHAQIFTRKYSSKNTQKVNRWDA
jgi:hypothetical protein